MGEGTSYGNASFEEKDDAINAFIDCWFRAVNEEMGLIFRVLEDAEVGIT